MDKNIVKVTNGAEVTVKVTDATIGINTHLFKPADATEPWQAAVRSGAEGTFEFSGATTIRSVVRPTEEKPCRFKIQVLADGKNAGNFDRDIATGEYDDFTFTIQPED